MKHLANIITLLLLTFTAAKAQTDFACVVVADSTMMPLSNASALVNGKLHAVADAAGRLEIKAFANDTIVIRHIGFANATLIVADSLAAKNIARISLKTDTTLLSEITVRPRVYTLRQLERSIPTEVKRNNIIAQHTFKQSKQQGLTSQPLIEQRWGKDENVNHTHQNFISQQEYKGMVSPDQTVEIIGIRSIAAIIALIKEIRRPEVDGVKPLSEAEIEILLGQN